MGSAADWLASPEVTAACAELKRQRLSGSFVLRKPDGKLVSRLGNVEKYGPSYFDHAGAEAWARELEADYDWPLGSVEVLPDWMAE